MKVAEKSPHADSYRIFLCLDRANARGNPKSVFVKKLLQAEAGRRAERQFYAQAVAAYTPEATEQTLALHADYPIDEA